MNKVNKNSHSYSLAAISKAELDAEVALKHKSFKQLYDELQTDYKYSDNTATIEQHMFDNSMCYVVRCPDGTDAEYSNWEAVESLFAAEKWLGIWASDECKPTTVHIRWAEDVDDEELAFSARPLPPQASPTNALLYGSGYFKTFSTGTQSSIIRFV